jgi:branched-chain amino acid transport system substrate-binding protein
MGFEHKPGRFSSLARLRRKPDHEDRPGVRRRRGFAAGAGIAATLAGALGLAAVAAGGAATATAAVKARSASAKSPITIGISLSLSGDFSDAGKPAAQGYELWASQVNAAGGLAGHKIILKIVDDASNPTQVVTNYENLISRDHVNLVFGPVSSLLTIPAAAVANRFGYAFVESSGGGPAVFNLHLHNLFLSQTAPIVTSGDAFARWVLSLPKSERPKTAAYPEADDPFAQPLAEAIRKKLQAGGIKTVYDKTYSSETTDLTPIVAQVAAAHPDIVVAGTAGSDAAAEIKAMAQLNFNPKILYMANGPTDPVEFPASVGIKNVDGIFGTTDWYPSEKTPGNKAFIAAFVKKFGGTANDISAASAEAYCAGQLLSAVAAKTHSVSNPTIVKTLHGMTVRTIEGPMSWNADGAPKGSDLVVQWVNRKLVPVYPTNIAATKPLYPKPAWGQ